MNIVRFSPWVRRYLGLAAATMAALSLIPVAPLVVAAQEASPVAEEEAVPEGVTFEFLAQAVAEEVPEAPAFVGLYRITVSPGAGDQIEPDPGVELVLLESGALMLDFEGPATVVRAGAPGTPAPQEEVTLNAGDAFLVSGGGFAARNDGAEPAQVVGLGVFPAGEEAAAAEGTPAAEEEMAGITFQPLVQGVAAELPQEATSLVLLRVTLEPGASAPPEEPHAGPELIFLESGSVTVTVTAGEAYILRASDMATPGAEMEVGDLATVGEEITLEAGDAFFAHTGSVEEVRNPGEEPTVALVGVVAPAGHEEAEQEEAAHATPVP